MNAFATGLFTGLLSIGLIAGWSPALRPTAALDTPRTQREQVFHVDVFLRDSIHRRESVDSREVQLVAECLRPVLARISDPEDCQAAVIETLGAAFPGRLTIDTEGPSYKAIWDPETERFVVMCCENTNLEVDVDGRIVGVPVTLGTRLR